MSPPWVRTTASTPATTERRPSAEEGEASTTSTPPGSERWARAALRLWARTAKPQPSASSTTTRPTWPVDPMTRTVDMDSLRCGSEVSSSPLSWRQPEPHQKAAPGRPSIVPAGAPVCQALPGPCTPAFLPATSQDLTGATPCSNYYEFRIIHFTSSSAYARLSCRWTSPRRLP